MTAIFKREWKSYFHGMMGYVLLAFMAVICGIYFWANNLVYGSAEFAYTLYATTFALLIYIPVLTMRSFSEEEKNKTDQLLLTSPVSVGEIVLGKFFSLLGVFSVSVAIFALMPLVLSLYGTVDMALTYSALLAYWLMGAACIALGMFVSSQTENQIVAALCSFGLLLLSYLMDSIQTLFTAGSSMALIVFAVVLALAALVIGLRSRSLALGCGVFVVGCVALLLVFVLQSAALTTAFTAMLGGLDLFTPYTDFVYGMFDARTLVYYLSVVGLFLFLTAQSIEKRRWN